jgi:hypothetical protein
MTKRKSENQEDEADAETNNASSAYKKWKQAWKQTTITNKGIAIASVVVAVATVIYAVVACYQLSAINEANRFSRESLEAVQRSFLTFVDVNGERTIEKHGIWSFAIVVENSGTTPAIDAISFSGADDLTSEPMGDIFSGTASMMAYDYIVIGPMTKKSIAILSRPDAFMLGEDFDVTVRNWVPRPFPGGKSPFLWAWVVYRDVFPNTKPHLTEYCAQILNTQVARDSLPDHPIFRANIATCQHHNCADEKCEDYSKVVALALAHQ